MTSDKRAILRMQGIVKDFPGTRALDRVDFVVGRGEVHALIGENGAGKSTLMNVLAGRFDDYEGAIRFDGREVRLTNPRSARDLGVAVIYQELSVLPNLTVAENIMLGEERASKWTRRMDRAFVSDGAREVIEYLGFDLDPDEPAGEMSAARQCLVEIAGAVRRNVKLLVFDEPTASLGHEDVERLFRVIRDLKGRGLGIVYISHRLAELPRIADRVTVLRDAKTVGTRDMAECQLSDLTRMMLGRDLAEMFPAKANSPAEVLLKVSGLTRPGVFEDVSFEVRAGEILGLAGLVGSGRSEIVRGILGVDHATGTVEFGGRRLERRTPGKCLRAGIGMVPENRKTQGNITGRPVLENITVGIMERLSRAAGWLAPQSLRESAAEMAARMAVDPPDTSVEIQTLSGGNQQKVIVGRWLAVGPKVIIFDEPTQGIDVGTKAQIYRLIADLAAEGRGVVLISSEFIELANLADRVIVVRNGRVAGEMTRGDLDEDRLFRECIGGDAA
ncbi:MAG: sugar ABC transporter ATP-binding protein [Planctomycetota bacterium]|jgi:ABC-type sugar transport system ATPase subunit